MFRIFFSVIYLYTITKDSTKIACIQQMSRLFEIQKCMNMYFIFMILVYDGVLVCFFFLTITAFLVLHARMKVHVASIAEKPNPRKHDLYYASYNLHLHSPIEAPMKTFYFTFTCIFKSFNQLSIKTTLINIIVDFNVTQKEQ